MGAKQWFTKLVDQTKGASVINVPLLQQRFVESLSSGGDVLAPRLLFMTDTWKLVAPGASTGLPDKFLALGPATKSIRIIWRDQESVYELLLHSDSEGRPPCLRSRGLLDTPAHCPGRAPASCTHSA